MRATVIALALIAAWSYPAAAVDEDYVNTGNFFFDGCKEPVTDRYMMGLLHGFVLGAHAFFPLEEKYCPVKGVTHGQRIDVVCKFLRDHPERRHEAFVYLTAEALQSAWPCKK